MRKFPEYALLDLDGVLSDFVHAACQHHGIANPYLNRDCHGRWDLAAVCGMENDEFWDALDSHEFWANIPPQDDMTATILAIETHFKLENVAICTAPSRSPWSASGKMSWVKTWLPDFHRRLIITPAKHFLAHENVLLIDDRDLNVSNFVGAGGRAITFPRPWNRRHHESVNAVYAFTQTLAAAKELL